MAVRIKNVTVDRADLNAWRVPPAIERLVAFLGRRVSGRRADD